MVAWILLAVPVFADSIDDFAAQLSASHLWQNGIFSQIDLPANASTDEVVAKVIEMASFNEGKLTSYKIIKAKGVQIKGSPPDRYTAVLLQTNFGEKIILLKYIDSTAGWRGRVYDTKQK